MSQPSTPTVPTMDWSYFMDGLGSVADLTGENNYLCRVAWPIMRAIENTLKLKIPKEPKLTSIRTFMNAQSPFVTDSIKPDIMMATKKGYHFLSVEVKSGPDQIELAFEEAAMAGLLATPETGSSVIILAVANTMVRIGLYTFLSLPQRQSPSDTAPANTDTANTPDGVFFTSAKDRLRCIPDALQERLAAVGLDPMISLGLDRGVLTKIAYVYDFDAAVSFTNNDFNNAFMEYLRYLTDPVCYAIQHSLERKVDPFTKSSTVQRSSNSEQSAAQLKRCLTLLYTKCPDNQRPAYVPEQSASVSEQSASVPEHFIVKRLRVLDIDAFREVHKELGCPLIHYAHLTPSWSQKTGTKKRIADGTLVEDAARTHVACIFGYVEGSQIGKPTAVELAKLMGLLIVLHDKSHIYHCDLRRPNVIVNGHSVRLIDFEHAMRRTSMPPELSAFHTNIRTVDAFQACMDGINLKYGERYVQLLDIFALFNFVYWTDGYLPVAFKESFRELANAEALDARTTSQCLQKLMNTPALQEFSDFRDAVAIAKRHNWFANYAYTTLCDADLMAATAQVPPAGTQVPQAGKKKIKNK